MVCIGLSASHMPPYTRFTVGLEQEPPYIHPFHCWARAGETLPTTRFTVGQERALPHHPFHCWARERSPSPTTRFTVGQEEETFSHHPFHCWARREEKREATTYPPWYLGGYPAWYMPPFQVLFTHGYEG